MKAIKYILLACAALWTGAAEAQTINEVPSVREVRFSPINGSVFVKTSQGREYTFPYTVGEHPIGCYPFFDEHSMIEGVLGRNSALSLHTEALKATGLLDKMNMQFPCDQTWNPDLYEDKQIYTGGQTDYCHVPSRKAFGFTLFVCPDEVLKAKYGITNLQQFYDYARSIYGGEALDVNEPANAVKLTDIGSPLRRLLAYNILDRKLAYDMLTTICTIDRFKVNPTEWYSTLDPFSTIKVESVATDVNKAVPNLYLNRGDEHRGYTSPGIHVTRPDSEDAAQEEAWNACYYLSDGLADYGEITQKEVFDTRMRVDFYTLFPELATYGVRTGYTVGWGPTVTNDPNHPAPNYWFPKGYLDDVKVNDAGIFIYQGCQNTFWCYKGDEFNVMSEDNKGDVTFRLPSVPTGTYQIRLGFSDMATRSIMQIYLDGETTGEVLDMRDTHFSDRTGWFPLSQLEGEEREAALRAMHEKGWYHGPASVYSVLGTGKKDEEVKNGNYFSENSRTVRYVIATAFLDGNKQHTLRFRNVRAIPYTTLQLDYIELVPESVFAGTGDKAEDIY